MQFISFYIKRFMVLACFFTGLAACKKFVKVDDPNGELVSQTVFTSDAKATAALLGIYSNLQESITAAAPGGTQSFTVLAGLSADELSDYTLSGPGAEFYANGISISNTGNLGFWRYSYQYIYQANAVLEGLANGTGISIPVKNQLQGEARFLRAFFHFYLLNAYGDIPWINTTDYKANAVAPRMSRDKVYDNIKADLLQAIQLLPSDYVSSSRARPNQWTARALLARVYLFTADWVNAEAVSTGLINNSSLYALESDLDKVFLKDSRETIWQLAPVIPGFNSSEGYNFILETEPSTTSLSPQLVNGFEQGDTRKAHWVDSFVSGTTAYYYPYKYKLKTANDITECSVVFRLAEQYLIRAEARARLNKLSGGAGALDDINTLRQRAGLLPASLTAQSDILLAIEQERKAELFSEWGQRWMDLKRTGRAGAVLAPVKAPGWQAADTLYPIPQLEIANNPSLTQNKGY